MKRKATVNLTAVDESIVDFFTDETSRWPASLRMSTREAIRQAYIVGFGEGYAAGKRLSVDVSDLHPKNGRRPK